MSEFKLLGQGFDTIQTSFVTRVPEGLSAEILAAQARAKETRKPEPTHLGPGQLPAEVLRHGGGGGDAIVSTGELGDMWFFKTNQKKDKWGVMIKVRSLALLCYGFQEAMAHVWERATKFGLKVDGYSLGRVDYRFDVLTDRSFAPVESCVTRHNRTVVRPYEVVDRRHPNWGWNDDPDVRQVLRGKRVETLMVGTIGSGTQVVIYDKRSELTLTRNHTVLERYGLDPADKDWGLWRVEVRFAGDVLKRHWNVRDLQRLETNLRPMLTKALKRVSYIEPGQGAHSRQAEKLHPLWTCVTDAIAAASCDQPSQFAPERAEHLIQMERERALKANIAGCALSLAASKSKDAEEVALLAPDIAYKVVQDALVVDPKKPADAVRRQAVRNRH